MDLREKIIKYISIESEKLWSKLPDATTVVEGKESKEESFNLGYFRALEDLLDVINDNIIEERVENSISIAKLEGRLDEIIYCLENSYFLEGESDGMTILDFKLRKDELKTKLSKLKGE
jgi:hypothetical protein